MSPSRYSHEREGLDHVRPRPRGGTGQPSLACARMWNMQGLFD